MATKEIREPQRFTINFGLSAGKLGKQLKQQKLRFDPETIRIYNDHVSAIVRLSIHELITDAEETRAFKRLMNKITKHVREHN
jgi:hypothetical protein